VTFDPFGDFETRGYLRNIAKAKDRVLVQRLQHNSFLTGIDAGLRYLETRSFLTYVDVLQTHKTLFEAVFPWAGEDRLTNAPAIFVNKGTVLFAHPKDIRRAVGHALVKGQDKAFMAERPGEIMGYLAYGHPFLDGNGRTIMLVHAELARRAGFGIDWSATDKEQYLAALAQEIETPKGSSMPISNLSSEKLPARTTLSPQPRRRPVSMAATPMRSLAPPGIRLLRLAMRRRSSNAKARAPDTTRRPKGNGGRIGRHFRCC